MKLRIHADDTQVYVSICPTTSSGVNLTVSRLELCVHDINEWMTMNLLKLNSDKTEDVMLGFKAQLTKINLTSVNIAGVDKAIRSDHVKNLGVMFDCGLIMAIQVANIARSAIFQLVDIGRAGKILTTESTKLVVHTLVTSRPDYCNSLLAGINSGLLKRLQK